MEKTNGSKRNAPAVSVPAQTSSQAGEPTLDGLTGHWFCPRCDSLIPARGLPACEQCSHPQPGEGWPLDPRLGSRVAGGQYRVLRRIGSGGFGVVYEVETVVGGLRRALKVLNRRWLDDPEIRERFINEALVLEQVNHSNVARCYAAGTLASHELYLLLELVNGVSVERVLKQSGPEWIPMEPVRAIRIARQVASGLVAAHSKGILHRDLKPANILVVSAGEREESVKLIDFGIAKERGSHKTSKNVVLGTPQFMAPEQFDPTLGPVSPALDLWQLGATLFAMLTGKAPRDDSGKLHHQISSPTSLAGSDLQTQRLPPRITGIPDLDQLLQRLLALDPANRPSSAVEVCEELAALEHQISPSATSSPTALLDVLCATPSAGSWRALCRHLSTQEEELVDQAVPRLSSWPRQLRGANLQWWEQIRRNRTNPLWKLARNLDLSQRYLSNSDLAQLAGSSALKTLEGLNLAGSLITDEGLAELARSPNASHLVELDLSENRISARGLRHLIESPYLRNIQVLHLARTSIGPEGASLLARCRWPLEYLDLTECDIRTAGAEALATGSFRALSTLLLGGNLLGADGIAALSASPIFLLLKRLDLTRNSAGPSGAASLAMASGLHQLRSLGMAQNNLEKRGLHLLLGSSALERLESLDVSSNSLGPSGALVLASSPVSRKLRRLDLSDNELEDAGLAALLGAPQLTGLRSLAVAQNCLTASGLSLLGGAPLQLEELDLSANPVSEGRWGIVSEALGKTRVLSLKLAGTGLTCKDLCRVLEGAASRLKALDVGRNALEEGIDRLPDCLEISALEELQLNSCKITARGLHRFLRSSYLRQLRKLELDSNAFGDEGCLELASANGLGSLRELSLKDNGIGPRGAEALASSPLVGHLTRLDLSYNQLKDLGAEQLARGRSMHSLQRLDLRSNAICMAGVAAITSAPTTSMLQQMDVSDNPLLGELDVHSLTLRKVELMESCYETLGKAGIGFAQRFYELLFDRFPRVKPLFSGVSILRQQQHLFSALVTVIENLRNPEKVESGLRELGQRHVGYGVHPSQYAAVSAVLLEVLEENLGEAWTGELAEAWNDGIAAVCQVMMNAHRQSRGEAWSAG